MVDPCVIWYDRLIDPLIDKLIIHVHLIEWLVRRISDWSSISWSSDSTTDTLGDRELLQLCWLKLLSGQISMSSFEGIWFTYFVSICIYCPSPSYDNSLNSTEIPLLFSWGVSCPCSKCVLCCTIMSRPVTLLSAFKLRST